MSGDAVELNADGDSSGKPVKAGFSVPKSVAATVEVVACSGAETLVDSGVNCLKEKAVGDEQVRTVERIDELKDAGGFACGKGDEEEEERFEKVELNASSEPSSSNGGRSRSKLGDSDSESLVHSVVNGLKERPEGDEEVSVVEGIDELKDAGLDCSKFESCNGEVNTDSEIGAFRGRTETIELLEQGDDEEEERSEKAELNASSEPSSSKGGRLRSKFGDSDLVWAKVRSHPWWPGQVFDASMASDKAKKYMKKERHLIAYFGDQSFAWNETSKIKPFLTNFPQMSNQKNSNLDDFHDAVDDALDEVSRRVEFGLSCPCVAEHSRIRTQVIVNPGVKDECCRRDGSDRFSTTDSFEPEKLVECIKRLGRIGRSPLLSDVDRLEFVTVRAQLLAFSRWKGFPELPELQVLGTVLNEAEAEADVPLSDRKEHVGIIKRDDKHGLSIKTYSSKRKRDSVVEGGQLPAKKERTLADYIAEMRSSKSNGKGKLDIGKSAGKKKKRQAADSDSGFGVAAKKKRQDLSTPEGSKNIVVETPRPKGSFGIGYSILKVASQMNSPSPILKSQNVSSRKSEENKGSKTKEKKKKKKKGSKTKGKKNGSENKSAKPRSSKKAPEELEKGSDNPESQVNSPEEVPNTVCEEHREEASKVETEMEDEQVEGTEEENLSEGNGNSKVETEMQDEQEGTDEENLSEGDEKNGEAKTTPTDELIQDIELVQPGDEQSDDASVPEQQNADEYVDGVDAVKEQQELQSSLLGSA